MPIRIPLDRHFHDCWYVLCRPNDVPDPEHLLDLTDTWLDQHASAPLRDRVRAWIARHPPEIVALPRAELPDATGPLLPTTDQGVEEDALYRSASHVVVVRPTDALIPMRPGFWSGVATARATARALGGLVMDPTRRVVHALDSCREALPEEGELELLRWFGLLMTVPDGHHGRLDTCGLYRFGLPDLSLDHVPLESGASAGPAMDGVVRALLDQVDRGVAQGRTAIAIADLSVTRTHVDRAFERKRYRMRGAPTRVGFETRAGVDGYPEVHLVHPRGGDPARFAARLARRLGR